MVLVRQNQNQMDIDQVISEASVKEKLALAAGKNHNILPVICYVFYLANSSSAQVKVSGIRLPSLVSPSHR